MALAGSLLAGGNRVAPTPPPPSDSIITDGSYTTEELVKDIFVKGTCDNISNISPIGETQGIGYFENGIPSIGINRGIILATGNISNSSGPNQATDRSGNFYDESGDPDLSVLSSGAVKDAVGIEFDFIPLDSFVTFRYVFASEEYCEFVGSIYNDVFGFFISGPGINGNFSDNAENVALVPSSNQQVSINTISHLTNSEYYRHNELSDDLNICGINNTPSTVHNAIEYDGFTTQLTATLQLIPCETYHIRLVVSDVGDNFYDSAVFLEAESFNLGGEVRIRPGNGITAANPALEGCEDAYFVFERADLLSLDFPLTVSYLVNPVSTAVEGADFVTLPGNITIPAGSVSAQLPISIINDGNIESVEEIVLELDIECACYSDTARMYIYDSPPIGLSLDDIAVCVGQSNVLTPEVVGGTLPYTYEWSDGSTEPSLSVSSDSPTQYYVTVVDACGNIGIDSAKMYITSPPEAYLNGFDTIICDGDVVYFPLELVGIPPWSVLYSIDGIEQAPLEGLWNASSSFPVTEGGLHELISVQDAACEGTAVGNAMIDLIDIQAAIVETPVSCYGGSDGALQVEFSGGAAPYEYEWLDGLPKQLEQEGLPAGTYTVVVLDGTGCEKSFEMEVESPSPIEEVQPDCNLLSENIIQISASGGTPPYLYSIDGENYRDESLFAELNSGTYYTIYIQDAAGCSYEHEFLMPPAYDEMVSLPSSLSVSLGSRETLMPLLQVPPSSIESIRWTPSGNLSCTDCLEPELLVEQDGEYTIRIVDIYGCTGEATILIEANDDYNLYVPNAFSPNGDDFNDRFTVYANDYQVRLVRKLSVFDRWGGMLFENTNFPANEDTYGWDGSSRGSMMDAGIYTYYAEIELYTGSIKTVAGHVLLVR
jgi:gliding motility-associated-like protein